MKKDKYFLVVPASGIGQRMNSRIPKQYIKLGNDLTILDQSLEVMLSNEIISGFVVALDKKDTHFKSSQFAKDSRLISIASGGKERFNSVFNALSALDQTAKPSDWVLVHDAVRPCIKKEDVVKLIDEVADDQVGGILSTRVFDTVKQKNNNGLILTIDRQKLHLAQTPQMFRYGILKEAVEKAVERNLHITDESEAVERLGYSIRIVDGSSSNIKITTQKDIDLANYFFKTIMNIKTGIGQDSHRFEKENGKPLLLAGIEFTHPFGLEGNSDADVVFHSITNSISSVTGINILGSVADQLAQKGHKDSSEYLNLALNDLGEWKINHIAIAIECQVPKISPQIDAMKENIAQICKINISDIGITATTGEDLTAFGRGEGIQVITIITVIKS